MLTIHSAIPTPTQPVSAPRVRTGRFGRPSRKRLGGVQSWIRTLVSKGRIDDAITYATANNVLPFALQLPAVSAHQLHRIQSSTTGGEGVQAAARNNNNYKSTQEVQILQSGSKLTLGVEAIREVDRAVALAVEAEYGPDFDSARSVGRHVHSPIGELEGKQLPRQAGLDDKQISCSDSCIESRWVEEGEGLVGKLCRNKQYNEMRMEGKNGELWTKVANWQWRNGLVRGERVWVKRVWVSADDTDSEYIVVRRIDVNEDAREEEVVVETIVDQIPAIEPVEPVVAKVEDQSSSGILPQFLKTEPAYPRKPETADEYIARIRDQASQWANGMGS